VDSILSSRKHEPNIDSRLFHFARPAAPTPRLGHSGPHKPSQLDPTSSSSSSPLLSSPALLSISSFALLLLSSPSPTAPLLLSSPPPPISSPLLSPLLSPPLGRLVFSSLSRGRVAPTRPCDPPTHTSSTDASRLLASFPLPLQVLRPPPPPRCELPQEEVRSHQPAAPQEEAQVSGAFRVRQSLAAS